MRFLRLDHFRSDVAWEGRDTSMGGCDRIEDDDANEAERPEVRSSIPPNRGHYSFQICFGTFYR